MERGEQGALELLGDASITCLLGHCSLQPSLQGLFLFCVMGISKADVCITAVAGAAAHRPLPAESLWAVYKGSR